MEIFLIVFLVLIVVLIYFIFFRQKPAYVVPTPFPVAWRVLLETNVHFYQNLSQQEKDRFEKEIRKFLAEVKIAGIKTHVEDIDRIYTACSAIIPLFGFPEWEYHNLDEVLLYPKAFDRNFSTEDPEEVILGMVGSGNGMDGIMILSQQSLRQGFENVQDKRNVGIHEFVHIMDKYDGRVDGYAGTLNQGEEGKRWKKLMEAEIKTIQEGKSDIDPYGATNPQEFLAVTSEYFFESPKLFKRKHPELYEMLYQLYGQKMAKRLKNPFRRRKEIRRNDPCPCGSGDKFKECCMED